MQLYEEKESLGTQTQMTQSEDQTIDQEAKTKTTTMKTQ
jgi:hypothetical protein